jgi:hypothetical protein
MSGYFAIAYGQRYEKQKPDDFFDNYFLGKLDIPYDLKEYDFDYDYEKERSLFTLSYDLPNYTKQTGGNIFVAPIQFRFRENPFKSERRFFPIDFGYPFTYHNVVKIAISDSLTTAHLPADTMFTIGSANYRRKVTSDDNWLTIESLLEVTKPVYLPQHYKNLRSFFSRVADAATEEVVLSMK